MIALVLIVLAAGGIGIRVHRAIQDKQFQVAVDRVLFELQISHRLALNMQADWTVVIDQTERGLVLRRSCAETGKEIRFECKSCSLLYWNEKPIERIAFQFASTGNILPKGNFALKGKNKEVVWRIPGIFLIKEGKEKNTRKIATMP